MVVVKKTSYRFHSDHVARFYLAVAVADVGFVQRVAFPIETVAAGSDSVLRAVSLAAAVVHDIPVSAVVARTSVESRYAVAVAAAVKYLVSTAATLAAAVVAIVLATIVRTSAVKYY